MIRARVLDGRLEAQDPIPAEWEGQMFKLVPLTPDDPLPNLEEDLAAFEKLGPVELDPDERQAIEALLAEQNELSRAKMQKLAGGYGK